VTRSHSAYLPKQYVLEERKRLKVVADGEDLKELFLRLRPLYHWRSKHEQRSRHYGKQPKCARDEGRRRSTTSLALPDEAGERTAVQHLLHVVGEERSGRGNQLPIAANPHLGTLGTEKIRCNSAQVSPVQPRDRAGYDRLAVQSACLHLRETAVGPLP